MILQDVVKSITNTDMLCAEKLRELMRSQSFTQESLGEAIGTNQQQIWRWLNSDKPPQSTEYLLRLARTLQTTVDYLIDDEATEGPHPIELPDDERFILETYRGLRDNQGMTCKEARDRLMARTAEAIERLLTWVEGGRDKAGKPADAPSSEAGKPGSGGVVRVRDIPRSKDGNGNSPGMNHSNDPVIPKPPDDPAPRRRRK